MGGGVSVIPDELDKQTVMSLMGKNYEQEFFDKLQKNGTVSKRVFVDKLHLRTDVFLTHDWGVTGQNHVNVGKVNSALKSLGVKTWFDEEQMQGNIKKQMVQGIDNSNCVVVFITARYVEKVSGENASDNCQLEFNYAGLQKTGSNMIAVVMEPEMRNTRLWGECGMVLGGNLYIDMSGNLDDEEYRLAKGEELKQAILQKNGKLIDDFNSDMEHLLGAAAPAAPTSGKFNNTPAPQGDQSPARPAAASPTPKANVPAAVDGPVKALEDLSVDDVGALLSALNMNQYREAVVSQSIDGPCLAAVEEADELKEMGVSMTAKAKMLFNRVNDFKITGVPEQFLHAAEVAKKQAVEEAAARKKAEEDAARAAKEQQEREERERQAAAAKVEKERKDAAAAAEKARKDAEAAAEKARKDAEAKAAAAKAAANALPSQITVGTHPHVMTSTDSSTSGWACDGKNFPGGCKSGCTGFRQLTGKPRWRCKSCDYDLCEGCARHHLITEKLPTTVFTAVHSHNLSLNSSNSNGWGCDGRQHGGCRSGSTGFRQLNGWNRYRCSNGCDFDLCEKCVRAHFKSGAADASSSSTSSAKVPPKCVNAHNMVRKDTNNSHWYCDFCRSASRNSSQPWAKQRWKCDRCDNDICDNCYNKVDMSRPPQCTKGHSMPYTMHKRGTTSGDYKHGWVCDICSKEPPNSRGQISGRFCCAACCSDLCSGCVDKRR